MARKFSIDQPGVSADFIVDGKRIEKRMRQANYHKIMDRNNELRKNPGAVKDLSFGRLALDIPQMDIPKIEAKYPGAMDPSHPAHKEQLRRFLVSDDARPYRVEDFTRRVPRG